MQAPTAEIRSILVELRSSYWFLPAMMMVASAVLAVVMNQVDQALSEWVTEAPSWLFFSGVDGGRAVLSAIATSMIGVAGVTFSITIVALAMASNQFGARMLRTFMRDRGNQVVLGTFVATFLYCLLVLRTIQGELEGEGSFVPHLSITVGVVLAVCSLAVLIFFIHHVANGIQAPQVVAAVARDLEWAIDRVYPASGDGRSEPDASGGWEALSRSGRRVASERSGYVVIIEEAALLRIAEARALSVDVLVPPGTFVATGEPVLCAGPPERVPPDVVRALARTVVVGDTRSVDQDAAFGIEQLLEMAIRALSPGINDPNTAAQAVDRIGVALAVIGGRPAPPSVTQRGEGRVRRTAPLLGDLVERTFDRLRFHAGGSDPELHVRLLEALDRVAAAVDRREGARAVLAQARQVRAGALERPNQPAIHDAARAIYARIEARLVGAGGAGPLGDQTACGQGAGARGAGDQAPGAGATIE